MTSWLARQGRIRVDLMNRWRRRYFSAYTADEPVAARFRARQLQAVLRVAPLTMLANGLNAVLIVGAFWTDPLRPVLLLWAAAITWVVGRGLRVWWRTRRRAAPARASARAMRRATLHASLLAALWAAIPWLLFAGAGPGHRLLLAVITTGMICAGGFALATTPVAGTAYVLILAGGAMSVLVAGHLPLARVVGALLFVYAYIVIASVWSTARMFGARLMAEAQAERQNEVIGLLLRDFEENASDLLWETDAAGRLRRVSPKLAATLATPAEQLAARPILDLLKRMAPRSAGTADPIGPFRERLRRGEPFRDLPLALQHSGGKRWWSVTAKPLRDAEGRVAGWRGVAADITQAHSATEQLTWLAHFDPLTGLTNRHRFRAQLGEMLAAGPMRPGCALLCLDLDNFKITNDTLGHAAGDALLQEVARRLVAGARRTDTVARLGGDEFAVILRELASPDEAAGLTQRLIETLNTPCEVQGARVAARASVGLVMVPASASDVDAVLEQADLALYAAKASGGGGFRVFEPQMAASMRRRQRIEQALRQALAQGELSLAYQPQVDLRSRRVIGLEALLRWQHPELGAVSPAEFVPVAEEAGLIRPIGQWVLAQACRDAMQWPQTLTVSVNVSPVQAMSHDLVPVTQAALRDSGLAASRLELEITESIFMHDSEATLAVLRTLRDSGVRVALDDFGTGYSSLSYLRRFPFDTLKIDRSFVHELPSRPDTQAIVGMIAALAATLRMKIVAEGVEDAAQLRLLESYGCDAMQGYLVARPMPAHRLAGFFADWGGRRPAEVFMPVETDPVHNPQAV
ncbi:MAG: EAL domain-containing protein [Burkholderiales bacterium]|nr:EAL domain-containing protein [Burkholderiales bacterium]